MRLRKNNFFVSAPESFSDEDSRDSDEQSDPKDTIEAVAPEEGKLATMHPLVNGSGHETDNDCPRRIDRTIKPWFRKRSRRIQDGLRTNKTWWAQCGTIVLSALLTYSYHNAGLDAINVQIAIMTVITLVGASPFCSSHLTTAAIGTFVGGQNIIGASGVEPIGGEFRFANYPWLLLLGICVGLLWSFVITHSKVKLLDGYAGRLGTTTFLGMNAVMICLWGPLGVVDWNRYYYGLVHIVHVAEEDSSLEQPSLASAWSWTEEAELAVGYVLAVLWIGVLGGATRIWHHQWVLQWHRDQEDVEAAFEEVSEKANPPSKAPTPLNNVLVPVLWTLFSILVVNATAYRHAHGLYNGFAVGAYVAMASLQKIPSIARFAVVSVVAALWGLALTPFFFGFAGKSGFTSMLGHVTHEALENLLKRSRARLQRQQRLREREEQQLKPRLREEEERLELERQERQQLQERQSDDIAEGEAQQQEPYYPPHKPLRQKKRELVLSTKQQRRQQQRMLQQKRQQQQHSQPQEKNQAPSAPLQHRGWVATPTDGDGMWEWHPALNDTSPPPSKSGIV